MEIMQTLSKPSMLISPDSKRAEGREVLGNGDVFHLRARESGYGDDSRLENDVIGL